jgi:hypothetical protein
VTTEVITESGIVSFRSPLINNQLIVNQVSIRRELDRSYVGVIMTSLRSKLDPVA